MADSLAAHPGRPGLRPHLRDRAVLAALALALCGAYLAAELYLLDGRLGFPLDDSWIHLAFGRSLAAGEGLAVNPGEAVAGSTSPLWTALFALWVVLPGSALAWAKAAGAVLFAGVVLLAHGLAQDLTQKGGLGRGLAFLAGSLTAATGWLVWSALSGMEIALFTALTLAGVRLHLRERREPERRPLSLAVLGLAVLARPEGALLVALALADRFLLLRPLPDPGPEGAGLSWELPGRRRLVSAAVGALAAAAIVAPVAAYYAWIGGSPLPTTLAVKTGHDSGLHLPDLRYLHVAMGVLFRAQPWCAVLAPAGALVLLRRLGTGRDRGLLPALWVAGLPLTYACLGSGEGTPLVGNFGRYLFPLLPFVAVLGVLALEPVVSALAPGRGRCRRALAAVGLVVLLWPVAAELVRGAGRYGKNVLDVEEGDGAMVRWLEERLPPEAVLGVVDLGYLAAELPNPILDLVGIASPEVSAHVRRARAAGRSWQDGVLAFIEERRPDYLVLFPGWLPQAAAPGSPFRLLHAVRVPDNITLGGDVIVLYATPWTRYPLREPAAEAGGGDRP